MSRGQRSAIRALLDDYRKFAGPRLWLAVALMFGGALAEGFGLLMIVPLAGIAIGERTHGRFAGFAPGLSADQRFLLALALFIAAMAARSALIYARDVELGRLQTGYEASLRLRSAATLARRGWTFAGRIGQAGMQSLLLTDIPRAGQAVAHVQLFAVAGMMLLVQFALAALLSPTLALLALSILALGSWLSVRWVRRGARSGVALVERSEESAGSGFRLHAGLKSALAQDTVPSFLAEYRSSLDRATTELTRFLRDLSAARSFAFVAGAVTAAMLLFVGYRWLALPFPVLITALVLFARMSAPAQQLQQSVQSAAALAPSFAAIERRLDGLEDARAETAPAGALEWSELRADAVAFEHREGLGLSEVSLVLRRGEWLGIGGPSGVGKTTLVDLIAGLLVPTQGILTVDGKALDQAILSGWRASLAYVGQEGSVFDDSVRGNLTADGAKAGEQALWQALAVVGLDHRVRSLPAGLDEKVGDRGSQLSGGERQRLALARAILRRPTLLILDEATSALDVDGEAELLERLRALEPRPAAMVVAHRPSTLAQCDSVVTIRHGMADKAGDSSRLQGD
jgi:ATP-binding cassette subfamily C protein